jgi:hypothetical protein
MASAAALATVFAASILDAMGGNVQDVGYG